MRRFLSALFFCTCTMLLHKSAEADDNPWFSGLDSVALNSQPIKSAKWRGRPALLQFWASWCQSCSGLMQELEAVQEKYPPLLYLAISIDNSLEEAKKAELRPSRIPHIYDLRKNWAQKFDVRSVPTIIVVDAKGMLRFRHEGHLDAVTALKLNQVLAALIAEVPKGLENVPASNQI